MKTAIVTTIVLAVALVPASEASSLFDAIQQVVRNVEETVRGDYIPPDSPLGVIGNASDDLDPLTTYPDAHFAAFSGFASGGLSLAAVNDVYTVDVTAHAHSAGTWATAGNTPIDLILQLDCGGLYDALDIVDAGLCQSGLALDGSYENPLAGLVLSDTTDANGEATFTFTRDQLEASGAWPMLDGEALDLTSLHLMARFLGTTQHYVLGAEALFFADEDTGDAYQDTGLFTPVLIAEAPALSDGLYADFAGFDTGGLTLTEDAGQFTIDVTAYEKSATWSAVAGTDVILTLQLDCGALYAAGHSVDAGLCQSGIDSSGAYVAPLAGLRLTETTDGNGVASFEFTADDLKANGAWATLDGETLPVTALHIMADFLGGTQHYVLAAQLPDMDAADAAQDTLPFTPVTIVEPPRGDGLYADFEGFQPGGVLLAPTNGEYEIVVRAHERDGTWAPMPGVDVALLLQLDCGGLYAFLDALDEGLCQSGIDQNGPIDPLAGLQIVTQTDSAGEATFTFTVDDLKANGAWPTVGGQPLPVTSLHLMAGFGGGTQHYVAGAERVFNVDPDRGDLMQDMGPFTPVSIVSGDGDGSVVDYDMAAPYVLARHADGSLTVTGTAFVRSGTTYVPAPNDAITVLLERDCGAVYAAGQAVCDNQGYDGTQVETTGTTANGVFSVTFTDGQVDSLLGSRNAVLLNLFARHVAFDGAHSSFNAAGDLLMDRGQYAAADALEDVFFTPVIIVGSTGVVCLDDPLDFDADGDGYPNIDEIAVGADPCDPDSTPIDWDGDGYTNTEECPTPNSPDDRCTDPRDAAMHPSEISAAPAAFTDAVMPGGTSTFQWTITNDGRAEETVFVSLARNSSSDWSDEAYTISSPDEVEPEEPLIGSAPADDPQTVTLILAPGASSTVTVSITAPTAIADGAFQGAKGNYTVTAEPQRDDQRRAATPTCSTWQYCQQRAPNASIVIDTLPDRALSLDLTGAVQTVLPGASHDYTITVTNDGNLGGTVAFTLTETYTPDAGSDPTHGYTYALLDDTLTPISSITVAAQSSQDVVLRVNVPAWDFTAPVGGAFGGDALAVEVKATLLGEDKSVDATTTTGIERDVRLGAAGPVVGNATSATPANTVALGLVAENRGNDDATIAFSFVGSAANTANGYTFTKPPNTPIGVVGRGDPTQDVTFTVTIPQWDLLDRKVGAFAGHEEQFKVRATSGTATEDELLNVTTLQVYGVAFKQTSQSKSNAPGTTATYTVTVTNTGNGDDTITVTNTTAFRNATNAPSDHTAAGYAYSHGKTLMLPPRTAGTGSASNHNGTVTLTVQVPTWDPDAPLAGAVKGAKSTVTLTATTSMPGGPAAPTGSAAPSSAHVTTTTLLRGLVLGDVGTTVNDTASDYPGNTATLMVEVRNIGNSGETVTFDYAFRGDHEDRGYSFNDPANVFLPVSFEGDHTTIIQFPIQIPAWDLLDRQEGAFAGHIEEFELNASIASAPLVHDHEKVSLETLQVYGVVVGTPSAAKSALPGASASYILNVSNTGNGEDTVTISNTTWFLNRTGVPGGYDDAGYVHLHGASITLPPRAQGTSMASNHNGTVSLTVDVPAWDPDAPLKGAVQGAKGFVHLTATTEEPTGEAAPSGAAAPSVNFTTTTRLVQGLVLGTPGVNVANATSGYPGDEVTLGVELTNIGNAPTTFKFEYPSPSGHTTRGYSFPAPADVTLPVAEEGDPSTMVDFKVTIPAWDLADRKAGALAGALENFRINASIVGTPLVNEHESIDVETLQVYGVTVMTTDGDNDVAPGATTTYKLRVTNTGNGPDTFTVATEGTTFTDRDGASGTYADSGYTDSHGTSITIGPMPVGTANSWAHIANVTASMTAPAWDPDATISGAYARAYAELTLNASTGGTPLTGNEFDMETFKATTKLAKGVQFVPLAGNLPYDPQLGHNTSAVVHEVKIRNLANDDRTYDLGFPSGLPTGWYGAIQACGGAIISDIDAAVADSSTGASEENATFCVRLDPAIDLDADTEVLIDVEAADGTTDATATLKTIIDQVFALTIVSDRSPAGLYEGEEITVEFTVNNTGDGPDTVSFDDGTFPADWTVTLLDCMGGPAGDVFLTESGATNTTTFCANVTSGWNEAIGNVVSITFTASSMNDNTGGVASEASVTVDFEITDVDTDRDGLRDGIDPDDDNDGFTDIEEIGAGSDDKDHFSTPLDFDADGVPDGIEQFVDLTFGDTYCTHNWPEPEEFTPLDLPCSDFPGIGDPDVPLKGQPPYAIPDATTLEQIDVYNVKVNTNPFAPLTRHFGGEPRLASYKSSDPACQGEASVTFYNLRDPQTGAVIPTVLDGQRQCLDVGETNVGPLTFGVDSNGDPVFEVNTTTAGVHVYAGLRGGVLRSSTPMILSEDKDGDGVPLFYRTQLNVTYGVPPTNTTSGKSYLSMTIPDPDDNDPSVPGTSGWGGDGFVVHYSFPNAEKVGVGLYAVNGPSVTVGIQAYRYQGGIWVPVALETLQAYYQASAGVGGVTPPSIVRSVTTDATGYGTMSIPLSGMDPLHDMLRVARGATSSRYVEQNQLMLDWIGPLQPILSTADLIETPGGGLGFSSPVRFVAAP